MIGNNVENMDTDTMCAIFWQQVGGGIYFYGSGTKKWAGGRFILA